MYPSVCEVLFSLVLYASYEFFHCIDSVDRGTKASFNLFYLSIVHISVTGMGIGLRKRWRGSDAFIVFGVPMWMLADVQMNGNISDAHAQWFSCWKIRADDCDVIS